MNDSIQSWRAALRGGRSRDLNTILLLAQDVRELSEPEQLDWLRSLVRWLRGSSGDRFGPETRVRLLLQRLNQHPEAGQAAAAVVAQILQRGSALRVFCEAGVPSSTSFFKELGGRLVRSMLPPILAPGSLSGSLQRVFSDRGDADWLAAIPLDSQEALLAWLSDAVPAARRTTLLQEATEAMWVLANRGTAIALMPDVAARGPATSLADHPMIRLEDVARAFAAEVARGGRPDPLPLLARRDDGLRFLDAVRAHLDRRGVSLDLVFQIERGDAYLERLGVLARTVAALQSSGAEPAAASQAAWALLVELVRGELQDRRPGRVVSQSLHLIARKTVERAGLTGEEGIARDRPGLRAIWLSALGGGAFIALTTFIKYLQPHDLPPFFHGLYHALNYSGSFIAMHFLHLKLATKMPAMTASSLASRLTERPTADGDRQFAETAAALFATQLAAIAGNLAGVIPAVLLLESGLAALRGVHLLDASRAAEVIQSNNPWASGTVFFAMLTGAILWLCGWLASTVDNAFVFHDVSQALAHHGGLRERLGPARLQRWVDAFSRHLGGVTAALIMGFALAFTQDFGEFFGLPLQVRHVTLVSGGLSLAVSSLGFAAVTGAQWAAIAVGIVSVALCNLGVSFVFAFWMALRARGVPAARGRQLLVRAMGEFLRHPLQILKPAASSPA
jgi:site-specific recombinase